MAQQKFRTVSEPLHYGLSPHYDINTASIYFVDGPKLVIYRHCLETEKTYKCKLFEKKDLLDIRRGRLMFAFPVVSTKNLFIAGMGSSVITFQWNGKDTKAKNINTQHLDEGIPSTHHVICCGKLDGFGNLWLGTIGTSIKSAKLEPEVSVYSLGQRQSRFMVGQVEEDNAYVCVYKTGNLDVQETGLATVKGMAWDLPKSKLYLTDGMTSKVYQYDYDHDNMKIGNQSCLVDVSQLGVEGFPRGIALDSDGKLWIALVTGSMVVQLDTTRRKILKQVILPTALITSLFFGGSNFDKLIVTSGRKKQDTDASAGCTFVVDDLGVSGVIGTTYCYAE